MAIISSIRFLVLPFLLGLCLSAHRAEAASSPWASSEGGRMRVIALPPDREGTIRAALEIEPKPGWITYWREPGGAGIPPSLGISPGQAFTVDGPDFPVPEAIRSGEIDEFIYRRPVALPFRLKPTMPATAPQPIAVTAFIGLCRQICIPFQAELRLAPETGRTGVEEALALSQAEKSLPRPPSEDFKISAHALSQDGRHLRLDLALPQESAAPPLVIVTGPAGHAFLRPSRQMREGRRAEVEFALDGLPKGYEMKGKVWRVLVVDGSRAIEAPLAFD